MHDPYDNKPKRKNDARYPRTALLVIGGMVGGAILMLSVVSAIWVRGGVTLPPPPITVQAQAAVPLLQADIRASENSITVAQWADKIGTVQRYAITTDPERLLQLNSVQTLPHNAVVGQIAVSASVEAVLLVQDMIGDTEDNTLLVQPDDEIAQYWLGASHTAFSPDGSRMAMAMEARIDVYLTSDNTFAGRSFNVYASPVEQVAISHDNTRLAIRTAEGLAVYPAESVGAGPVWRYTLTNTPVYDMLFAPDNRLIVVYDDRVVLYGMDGSSAIYDLPIPSQPSTSAAVSADGMWMAVTATPNTYVWRLDDGGALTPNENSASPRVFTRDVLSPIALTFVPGRPWLVVADSSGALRVWNVDTAEIVAKTG